MDKGTLIIDDLNQYEAEKLVELMKPDLFCAGIKEKYSVQKLGVPHEAAAQLRLRRSVRRALRARSTSTARSTGW